jgi:hypothetical protein
MEVKRNVYSLWVGRPERNRLLGRPRHKWVDNIEMDHTEKWCDAMDWIAITEDRDQ